MPLVVLGIMAVRLLSDARTDSLTVDEPLYIQAGVCALTSRHLDVDTTNPPLFKLLGGVGVMLLAKPGPADCRSARVDWRSRSVFSVSPASIQAVTVAARLPLMGLTLALAIVVFAWGRALYGYPAGLLAMAIMAFEPTVVAHGHLVTGDLSLAFGVIACLMANWYWHRTRHRRWLLIAGVGLGWALLSKVSALELLPVLAVIEIARAHGAWPKRAQIAVTSFIQVAAVAWATSCLAYLPFTTASGQFRWTAPLSWVAPPQWFDSLMYQFHHMLTGHPAYLNGQIAAAHGFWAYFLEAFALKTTLGLLLLAAAGTVLLVQARDRIGLLYVGLPSVVMIMAATLGGIDIGVRYILPVYPLAALAAARVVSSIGWGVALRRVAASVAFCALALSSVGNGLPDIGYFNELAQIDSVRYLSDSNLDWGQDSWRLKAWWDSHGRPPIETNYFGGLPLDLYGIPSVDTRSGSHAKYLAISVEMVTTSAHELLDVEPVERIGTSIWIYRISG